jgi:flagellar protein FlaE
MIVVEWLEYLTDASGYRETARAIDYYEDIEWIGPGVAEDLREYLRGFDDVDGGGDGLTIDDHTTSLEYISQLDGTGGASVALSKLGGGGGRGIQR